MSVTDTMEVNCIIMSITHLVLQILASTTNYECTQTQRDSNSDAVPMQSNINETVMKMTHLIFNENGKRDGDRKPGRKGGVRRQGARHVAGDKIMMNEH